MNDPRFEKREAFRVIGLKVRAKPFSDEFSKVWDAFVPRIGEISGRLQENESYAVEWDEDKDSEEFNYLAGVAVNAEGPIPEGMEDVQVPAHEYAVFNFSLQEIQQAMKSICQEWLHNSEYESTGGHELEVYDERFNPPEGKFEMSAYIPVKKR